MKNKPTIATVKFVLCNVQQPDGSRQKQSIDEPVYVHTHGLETADGRKEHYDEADCALMNYALEHYDFWRARYPASAALFANPGVFGENFATLGITEQTVCLGDIYQVGTALLQVSWGREACGTMAARLQDEQAPEVMHQQSRNGWFYRVLQAGEMQSGTALSLIERPYADWPLVRAQQIIFNPEASLAELEALGTLSVLSAVWRDKVSERLAV
ncbi:MOSC domain-containing protein [Serratia fonticola]|jgi:MOSC domain-containing protein YiiM|uniref:MOSC domain-containing protein n=1 Tax=Serratia fonticola TaxID=47917 RepID=UPI002179A3DE|nr:MOSC domain-containing protein [Serratia fonticola]CAI1592955.1 6-N-hydroxylaminopurine resistance protein [Serratia fonticola]